MKLPQTTLEHAPPIPEVCPVYQRTQQQAENQTGTPAGLEPNVPPGRCATSRVHGPFYKQRVAPAVGDLKTKPVVTRSWICLACWESDEQDFIGWAPGYVRPDEKPRLVPR